MSYYTLAGIKKILASHEYYKTHPKELEKEANKYFKQGVELSKRPKAKTAILTVTYPRSAAYKNHSARAVLEVTYANGRSETFAKTISGAGYDKVDMAVAYVLNEASMQNLNSMKTRPKTASKSILVSYDVGTGLFNTSKLALLGSTKQYYGFTATQIKDNKTEQVFIIKW